MSTSSMRELVLNRYGLARRITVEVLEAQRMLLDAALPVIAETIARLRDGGGPCPRGQAVVESASEWPMAHRWIWPRARTLGDHDSALCLRIEANDEGRMCLALRVEAHCQVLPKQQRGALRYIPPPGLQALRSVGWSEEGRVGVWVLVDFDPDEGGFDFSTRALTKATRSLVAFMASVEQHVEAHVDPPEASLHRSRASGEE